MLLEVVREVLLHRLFNLLNRLVVENILRDLLVKNMQCLAFFFNECRFIFVELVQNLIVNVGADLLEL